MDKNKSIPEDPIASFKGSPNRYYYYIAYLKSDPIKFYSCIGAITFLANFPPRVCIKEVLRCSDTNKIKAVKIYL